MTLGRRRPGSSSLLATITLAAVLAACGGSSLEAFCDRAEAASQAGPLFPARTDGEPVPNPDALAALESMANASPDEVADELAVLVDEARALADQARSRRENGSDGPNSSRWSRTAVEQAQRAVLEYVDARCDIDLSSQHTPSPPEVTG